MFLKVGENSNNNSATLPFQSSFIPAQIKPQPGGPAQEAGHASSAANFHIKHVVITHGHYMNIFLTHQPTVVLLLLGAVLAEL